MRLSNEETIMKVILFILFMITSSLSTTIFASEITPFHTDGCSSYPNGTIKHPNLWVHCCIAHDIRYWIGGSRKDKKNADTELNRCVAQVTSQLHGSLMEIGVEIGGEPINEKIPWRWAFGFKQQKYNPLSLEQLISVYNNLYTVDSDIRVEFSDLTDPQIEYIDTQFENIKNKVIKDIRSYSEGKNLADVLDLDV